MNILVCHTRHVDPSASQLPCFNGSYQHGYNVIIDEPEKADFRPDCLLLLSVANTAQAAKALQLFPGTPLFVYHWDCYSWVWTNPRENEYDYRAYGELLYRAREVWVPSECTGCQAQQWWALNHWQVIPSTFPLWDPVEIDDHGYLLCPLRPLPDHWCYEFEVACGALSLPYHRSTHNLPWDSYKALVANCRAVVNHYQEASTGSLTLLEAYRLGKPIISTNSIWNGAKEYFGDRATYFRSGDRQSLQDTLHSVYHDPPIAPPDCKRWADTTYSNAKMLNRILERIRAYL